MLPTGSGKHASFPATVAYLMDMTLEESQRNIISVPCCRIAEE
jgi:hypothetical protein